MTVSRLRLARGLDSARAYEVPRHPAPIDLWLASNEGRAPRGLAPFDELLSSTSLARYPDTGPLREALGERLGVAPDQVLVTNGADDALQRVCLATLEPGREALVATPTFEMIPRYVALAGGTLREVAWDDGAFPTERVLELVSAATSLIAVVSPNNPTGAVATARDLERLAAAAPGALLLVDHAYAEFADEDLTSAALELGGAIVLRTLSKAFGLAGLRVGYAVGRADLISAIACAGDPFPVSSASLAIASARLATGDSDVRDVVTRVRSERGRLEGELRALGARPVRSQANFVFARTADPVWLRDALAGLGIAVRVFPGRPGLEDALRITCPGHEDSFARLVAALRAALAPQALIFDMDGVLADVSGSYRRAVLETAASFGISLTTADVARAKAAGDANDDWSLTQRLCNARGLALGFAEVKTRFEELYQGSGEREGLRTNETLLLPRRALERLRSRVPLGIVTGRPEQDAQRFLEEQGVLDVFDAVICREHAPLKPDPAPVHLACERLGAKSAWMIGDTVDDVTAARGAGVVPIGCVAPGDDSEQVSRTLLAAGAARVLARPADLEGLLS